MTAKKSHSGYAAGFWQGFVIALGVSIAFWMILTLAVLLFFA